MRERSDDNTGYKRHDVTFVVHATSGNCDRLHMYQRPAVTGKRRGAEFLHSVFAQAHHFSQKSSSSRRISYWFVPVWNISWMSHSFACCFQNNEPIYSFYLRQESYVFATLCLFVCLSVCLSVCLCVNKITQKVMDGSFWNFEGMSGMAQTNSDSILGVIRK